MSEVFMDTVPSPSTVLAQALTAINTLLLERPPLQEELVAASEHARVNHEAVWELEAEELYEIIRADPREIANTTDLQLLARRVGILDAWHRFANPGLAGLEGALLPSGALRAEAHLDREGRLNEDFHGEHGHLIPAVCADAAGAAYVSRVPLADEYQKYLDTQAAQGRLPTPHDRLPDGTTPIGANQLLKNTTWLPRTIACGHPDGTAMAFREVNTGYIRIGNVYKSSPIPVDADLRIAVAPLAEMRTCIALVVTDAGRGYLVTPVFPIERVKSAIKSAFSSGVHILLFPEMTIREEWLTELAEAVRVERKKQRRSVLRYIILGTTRAPSGRTVGENFIAIIDGSGNLISSQEGTIARQDKICRWNLAIADQRRFGFDRGPNGNLLAPLVVESINQARTVFVFDVLGFGRMVCLICASLEHNQPSDWLVQHTQPDWVYAPVMDSSTCWTGSITGPLEKWTVKRAVRAACLSRAKVIVSNSMALQEFENDELMYNKNPDLTSKTNLKHEANLTPAVALMIDGNGDKLLYQILRASIPKMVNNDAPILSTAVWNDHWSVLPYG